MDPNIDPTTTSDITPDPARVTPTLPDDDADSSDVAAPQPSSGQPSPQVPRPTSTPQSQPSSPATAPANALKPSSSSQVHGVLGGVLMGALAGAARKVAGGIKAVAQHAPLVHAVRQEDKLNNMRMQEEQQDAQIKQQKAGQEATTAMDEHTLKQVEYNNATLTNHHLMQQAKNDENADNQAQSDLARQFKAALKKQGMDLDSNHGADTQGLNIQDAEDVANGRTIHIYNGMTGREAGVEILNAADLNQPLLHDIKMPLKMEIDPKTGKLVTTDEQTIKADGHNTVGTAFSAFQNSQRMGVQAQTEFDQQQKNIESAAKAAKAGEEKPEATPKTLIESSVALVDAKKALAVDPQNPQLQQKLAATQAEHDQIMKDAKESAAEKHEAGEIIPSPAEVDAFGNGHLTMTPYIIGRQPQLIDQILARWPDYDMTKGESYAGLRTEFTKGKVSQGINSFNTALNHIGEMWPHITALSATKGVQDLAQISGDKDADAVNATKTVLADELGKAYKSGALTEQEHDHMEKLLGGRTPNELKNNIQTFVNLLNGKLDAYQQQWRTGKPSPAMEDFPVVSPLAQQVIQTVSGGKGGTTPQVPQGKTPAYSKSTGQMIGYADDANGTNFVKF